MSSQTKDLDLEERVKLLEDKEAIKEVVQRYVRALDSQDPELLRTAFTEDAIVDIDVWDRAEGLEEIVDMYSSYWEVTEVFNHHVTNQIIKVDGDKAYVTSYALVRTEDIDGNRLNYGGYYERHLERRDEGWLQTELNIGTQYYRGDDLPSFRKVEGNDELQPTPQDHPLHPNPLFPD